MSKLIYSQLSNTVLGACFSVHNILGPGLLESAYEGALVIELAHLGIPVERQKVYPVYYKGELAGAYIADIVVDGKIILELKSAVRLTGVMEAQLINYLRLSKIQVGYLVNFRNSRVEWKRFVFQRD
ncbi:MAG: GxxExxY protein [Spirochaetia bacterium]|jgi:GxxExxY protein|nr:GxxExxY protein [Spirochaetia bacterium]